MISKADTLSALSCCAVLCASSVLAETVPAKGAVDSRVRVAAYSGDEVYRLHGFVGYQIDLEFEAGETFIGLGAGDLEGLSFAGQENHLFLKPKAAKVMTNLTVLTSRRHYHFDYAAAAQRPAVDDPQVIYSLRFTYPVSPAKAASDEAAEQIAARLDNASSRRVRNVDYWYCGDPALRPVAASDDGMHTRLKFSLSADLPAVFVRNEDGTESLLNYSMDGRDVIIHRIAKRFIVRRGSQHGCIVNQGFGQGESPPDSGTVAPDVERHVYRSSP